MHQGLFFPPFRKCKIGNLLIILYAIIPVEFFFFFFFPVKALTIMLGDHSYNLDFITGKFWLSFKALILIFAVVPVRKFLQSLKELMKD